jgi:metal-dependent amidase/aminoacylase/carboxypeptidase family protein
MKRFAFTIFAAALMVSGASAQEIQKRKENQQDRIAQGVKSGQLTAGETANLEHKEANLNREIRHDRKQNGGNLTNQQKRQINRQQNKLSKQIYRDKHNGRRQ